MKKITLIIILFSVFSCNYFEKPVPNEKELLAKELKNINWNEVDVYPSISECDSILDKEAKKQCFFSFLSQSVKDKLTNDTLAKLYPDLDTIEVKVTISQNAILSFEPQFQKDSIVYDKQKIDSILKARLVNFPKLNPAQKHGIPVKTQFILPVVLNKKN